jgi:ribosomal-protein-alanine N-acetyltransferase
MSADAEPRVFRPMKAADLDRVLEIAAELEGAPRWPREVYEAMLDPVNAGRRIALVAEDVESDLVAGFAVASVASPEAELETIGVAIGFQRRGIGADLVREMGRVLGLRGVTKVQLEVRDSNLAAKRLYGSLGFIEDGRRGSYYADPIEDAVLMRLDLNGN